MTIPAPSSITTEVANASTFPVRLYHIGGPAELYLTDADVPVWHDGQVWSPRGVSYKKMGKKLGLEVDKLSIVFDNIDDFMITWAVSNDPTGYQSSVLKGLSDGVLNGDGRLTLIDDYAATLFTGKITSMKTDAEFELTISSNVDFHRQGAPRAKQDVTCRFIFKDVNCGYAGAETVCNYTYTRCQELNNALRFGGFPDLNSDTNE